MHAEGHGATTPAPAMTQEGIILRLPSGQGRLARLSRRLARAEILSGGVLVAVIFALMLANAVSRGFGRPLIWTDELAVHLMVWLAFIGGSAAVALKGHMVMGLLPEILSPRAAARLALVTDLLVLLFLATMAAVIWRWLDLPGLIRAGSGAALAQHSFNFIYTDPTLTLGLHKIWFWLVMPVTVLTAGIHALAAVAEDLACLRGKAP